MALNVFAAHFSRSLQPTILPQRIKVVPREKRSYKETGQLLTLWHDGALSRGACKVPQIEEEKTEILLAGMKRFDQPIRRKLYASSRSLHENRVIMDASREFLSNLYRLGRDA